MYIYVYQRNAITIKICTTVFESIEENWYLPYFEARLISNDATFCKVFVISVQRMIREGSCDHV